LAALGIDDETTRQYLVWRKSTLLLAGIATSYSAASHTQTGFDLLDELPDLYSPLGRVLLVVYDLALFALPISALVSYFLWARLKFTRLLLVAGWATSFLVPVLMTLIPAHEMFNWEGLTLQVQHKTLEAIGEALELPVTIQPHPVQLPRFLFQTFDLLFAVFNAALLLPTVLSIIPGMFRACIRLKIWLPESVLPGWSLVTASPLYCLGFLILVVNLHQIVANWLLLASALVFAMAPLVYTACAPVLLKPLARDAGGRQYRLVRAAYSALGWLGVLLFVIYLCTREITIGGQVFWLIGFDVLTSLVRPWDIILQLLPFWVEYMGRALFITVMVADLILRMHCSVWAYWKTFANTAAAGEYDEMMGKMSGVVGAPPAQSVGEELIRENGETLE